MKAEEYPDDADRNFEAAARLERIADDLRKVEGSQWHWRLQALAEKNPDSFGEILSGLNRAVGFRSSARTGTEFLQELIFLLAGSSLERDGVVVPLRPSDISTRAVSAGASRPAPTYGPSAMKRLPRMYRSCADWWPARSDLRRVFISSRGPRGPIRVPCRKTDSRSIG